MVRKKTSKSVALTLAAFIIAASFMAPGSWLAAGVSSGSPLFSRLVYSFIHAGPVHALFNAWCLLSLVFIFNIGLSRLILAWIAAAAVPPFLLSEVPTVGLSCVCYFLLGSVSFIVERKAFWQMCMALFIGLGFLFPGVNAYFHLYGYLAGLLVGLLDTPLVCFRK